MKENVIAIDGPAASGKSSVAKAVAIRLEIPFINTGNMYRAVTYKLLKNNIDSSLKNVEKIKNILDETDLRYERSSDGKYILTLDGQNLESEIRAPETALYVSRVAAVAEIRTWLVALQRKFACGEKFVMEGRDIGTVVFPNAQNKFFLTATPEIRAERRLAQKNENPENATVESVAREIRKRDEMDTKRKISPLKKADDALLIDTSDMTLQEVVDNIVEQVK